MYKDRYKLSGSVHTVRVSACETEATSLMPRVGMVGMLRDWAICTSTKLASQPVSISERKRCSLIEMRRPDGIEGACSQGEERDNAQMEISWVVLFPSRQYPPGCEDVVVDDERDMDVPEE